MLSINKIKTLWHPSKLIFWKYLKIIQTVFQFFIYLIDLDFGTSPTLSDIAVWQISELGSKTRPFSKPHRKAFSVKKCFVYEALSSLYMMDRFKSTLITFQTRWLSLVNLNDLIKKMRLKNETDNGEEIKFQKIISQVFKLKKKS